MAGFNKIILMGNIARDPEKRGNENGPVVTAIATSERFKDKSGEQQERTEFHDLVFWGKMGEVILQHVQKGTSLLVEGTLQSDTYEKDGVKRKSWKVNVRNWTFAGRKADNQNGQAQGTGNSTLGAVAAGFGDSADMPF